jgi:hypothetical protein
MSSPWRAHVQSDMPWRQLGTSSWPWSAACLGARRERLIACSAILFDLERMRICAAAPARANGDGRVGDEPPGSTSIVCHLGGARAHSFPPAHTAGRYHLSGIGCNHSFYVQVFVNARIFVLSRIIGLSIRRDTRYEDASGQTGAGVIHRSSVSTLRLCAVALRILGERDGSHTRADY